MTCVLAGNIILFIDEVHTLVGSGTVGKGNKGSGLDIANLLKPSLGRGEFQVISLINYAFLLYDNLNAYLLDKHIMQFFPRC